LEVLTHAHGRHLGLVRGGASRRSRPSLLPGNTVRVGWRARLNEHLGNFTVELLKARAGEMLDSREALAGLNAFCAVVSATMPERESHQEVFEAGNILLDAMQQDGFPHWGALYVRLDRCSRQSCLCFAAYGPRRVAGGWRSLQGPVVRAAELPVGSAEFNARQRRGRFWLAADRALSVGTSASSAWSRIAIGPPATGWSGGARIVIRKRCGRHQRRDPP